MRVLSVLLFFALPGIAQLANPVPTYSRDVGGQSQPDNQQASNQKPDGNAGSGESNDRLFYALPNFLTVENANQLPPLTAGQKFKLQARSQFDYVEIPWYGILAGFSQARDTSPGYGQGAAGYAKRYASEWGDGAIENFMTAAVFSSVLRQDPRYYQLGKGSFWHRVGYAITRIVITRSDSGAQLFNSSEIFGSAVAAGISTYTYHPHDERTLRNTASVWGTQIGLDTFTINVKEFWPDIHRKFSHLRQTHQNEPQPPAP